LERLALDLRANIVYNFTNLKEVRLMAEIGYCVKCKAKKDMKDTQKVTMKNKRQAMKGKCTTCGTGMYKIIK
jgi:hypothetical protein